MKNLFRKIICAVLTLSAVMICGVSAFADTVKITKSSDAKYGVVYILSAGKTEDGNNGVWRGSGFAVGDPNEPVQYIVTNAHVVLDGQKQKCSVKVYFSEATNDFVLATIYKINAERDVAVLKLPEPTTKRTALTVVKYDEVEIGESVMTVGYPAVSDSETADPHPHDTTDVTVRSGVISKKTVSDFEGGARVFQTDAEIDGGNSGGPLVNSNGQAVGINSFTYHKEGASKLHYAICMDEVLDLVPNNEIGIVFAKDYNPDASNKPASTDETKGIPPAVIIIGVFVVIAAAVVLIVVFAKKKKAASAAPAQQASAPVNNAPAAPAGTGTATLICEKGILAGRTFTVGSGVIIGRNPEKCSVCFPLDTKGISGVHCEIRKTANGYEIIDRGSSYGTTLGNGQKLSPNVPVFLPDGTYFSLGGVEQMFRIKY